MRAAAPDLRSEERKGKTINLRLSESVRQLIDRAAAVAGKTRTEFVVESARRHAEDVLMEQKLFSLDDDRYQEFVKALDSAPPPNERLVALLRGKAPWER